jgi:hypothetical protein
LEAAELPRIEPKRKPDTGNSNKGFLKDKDYQPEVTPEAVHEDKITAPSHPDALGDQRITYKGTKQPRPVQEIPDKKTSPKKVARARYRQHLKSPQFRKILKIRQTLVGVAILILVLSIIISYQNYDSLKSAEGSLEENSYNFMVDFSQYDKLTLVHDTGFSAWDVNKFLKLTSAEIILDFQPDFNLLIEVFDVSNYAVKYNRTLQNDLAWSNKGLTALSSRINDDDGFSISTMVNIYVSPSEVHLAKLKITVWEN